MNSGRSERAQHNLRALCRSLLPGLALGLMCPAFATAADYQVTGTSDGLGSCVSNGVSFTCPTLRSAVIATDTAGGSNTIHLLAGTYALSIAPSGAAADPATGDLDVSSDLTIMGAGVGSTTIDAGSVDRAFSVSQAASLRLEELAVVNGQTGAKSSPDERGGAILATGNGKVALEVARLANNKAQGDGGALAVGVGGFLIDSSTLEGNASGGNGGAVFATEPGPYSGSSIAYTITSSTIARNTAAGGGGGISVATFSRGLTITNTTIFANGALGSGGGIDALLNPGTATITNATIVSNSSASAGGNIHSTGAAGVLQMENTIVGAGSATTGANCALTSFSLDVGDNLFFTVPYSAASSDDCFSGAGVGDILAADPRLAAGPGLDHDPAGAPVLAGNGGPTQTVALLGGSAAIDTAGSAFCSLGGPNGAGGVDQRGGPRFVAGVTTCDIGAYEAEAPLAQSNVASGPFVPEEPPVLTQLPPPAPPAQQAPAAAAKKVVRCKSLRHFAIHIQNVRRLHLVSATVAVDHRKKVHVSGRRLTAKIDLRNLPKLVFRVKIVARQRNGHLLSYTRVYHPCRVPRLPGHKYLPL